MNDMVLHWQSNGTDLIIVDDGAGGTNKKIKYLKFTNLYLKLQPFILKWRYYIWWNWWWLTIHVDGGTSGDVTLRLDSGSMVGLMV